MPTLARASRFRDRWSGRQVRTEDRALAHAVGCRRVTRSALRASGLLVLALRAMCEPATPPSPRPPATAWQPPPPPPDTFDWIQLNSGEWLKGQIRDAENGQLEFDSEKLKTHTFDIDDVIYVRSPRRFDVVRTDHSIVSGPLEITRNSVKIDGGVFPRSAVMTVSPSSMRERQHWSGELATGLITRSGNTNSADLAASANLIRRTPLTRLALDYDANMSQQDQQETANNQRGSVTFDKFLSAHAFLRVPSGEYFTDRFQNIQHRATLGAAYGYDFYRQRKRELDITIGPAWQRIDYVSVVAGEDPTKDTAALVVTSHYSTDLTSHISWNFDYRGQLTKKEAGETTHHAEATLEIKLIMRLELDLSLTWDRVSQPKPDDNGNVSKPDDFRFSVNFSVKL